MTSTGAIYLPFNIKPIPTLLLKKCFLKVLYNALTKGKREQYAKLLRIDIAPYFSKKVLRDDEYDEGIEALQELKRDGYIKISDENKSVYLLTDKGNKVARLPIDQMKLPNIDILDLIISPSLMFKVHNEYVSGGFENSISNALKLLEVTIRSKAKLPNSAYGKSLIKKAFLPETGILINPKASTPQEAQGFLDLISGIFGIIRNPSGHRFVDYEDPNEVIRIIGFIQFLLDQVNQCRMRESD